MLSNGDWTINVSASAISLTTRRYKDWMDFESRLMWVFDIFYEVFDIHRFIRVGLRYINAIRPVDLGLGTDSKDVLKGPMSEIMSSSSGTFKGGNCVLDRDFGEGVSNRTSVSSIVFTDGQPGFAIDIDVFTSTPVDSDRVWDVLRSFNEKSNDLFTEVASDALCRKVGL